MTEFHFAINDSSSACKNTGGRQGQGFRFHDPK